MSKKTILIVPLLIIVILVISACTAPAAPAAEPQVVKETVVVEVPAERPVLNVYNVAGYEDFYKARAIDAYREAFPDVEVNYVTGKWEELLSKIKAIKESGAFDDNSNDVHVIISGSDGVNAFAREGLIEATYTDFGGQIPNIANLAEPGQIMLEQWDGNAVTSHVDYYPLLMRNPNTVPDAFEDVEALKAWIIANPGHFMYSRPANSGPGRNFVLGIAAALGEDLENPAGWTTAWDYLKEIDPYITTYPGGTSPSINAFAGGEVDVIPLGWGWQADLKHFLQIPPATALDTGWTPVQIADPHGMMIAKGVNDASKEAAVNFINFVLEDSTQALMGEVVHYPATVSGWEAMPEKYQGLTAELMDGVSYPDFLAGGGFIPQPTADAMTALFDEWDAHIGAAHEYKGS